MRRHLEELEKLLAMRTRNKLLHRRGNYIVYFPSIPFIPNLIGQVLVNQQGLDVDFGEHGLSMPQARRSASADLSQSCRAHEHFQLPTNFLLGQLKYRKRWVSAK